MSSVLARLQGKVTFKKKKKKQLRMGRQLSFQTACLSGTRFGVSFKHPHRGLDNAGKHWSCKPRTKNKAVASAGLNVRLWV